MKKNNEKESFELHMMPIEFIDSIFKLAQPFQTRGPTCDWLYTLQSPTADKCNADKLCGTTPRIPQHLGEQWACLCRICESAGVGQSRYMWHKLA